MSASAVPIRSTNPPTSISGLTLQSPLEALASIPLAITNPDDPDFVDVFVPNDQRYISIQEGASGVIVWNLSGDGTANATFDNPAISFDGSAGPTLNATVTEHGKVLTILWSNDLMNRGLSFYYRLRVLVEIGGVKIPVTHDPTVHNDPPTP
jgi:hypothetical protein